MRKGALVLNTRSLHRGRLVHGQPQDPPFNMHGAAQVYSVRLNNGSYRYWDVRNVLAWEWSQQS